MSTKTHWGLAVDLTILNNDVTVKSSSENPEKFELEKFAVTKENLIKAFKEDLGVTLPKELLDAIPSESTEIRNLIIDGSKTPNQVEFEVATTFSEDFILNRFKNLMTIKSTGLHFKIKPDE